jgi:hypothetical protein
MEVFALPDFLPGSKLELFEAAFKGFHFSTTAACREILPCEMAQILPNQTMKGRAAFQRNLANTFRQLFW